LGCISKTWSLSTVCENMRRKRPLTAEKSFSPKKSIFNGSKLRSCFSPFVDQSSPDYVSRRGRDLSLQRRFPIVDIWLSEIFAIEVWSRPKSRRKKHVFAGPPNFSGEDPQFLDLVFKTAHISDHAAKFRGDRPRDRGDLGLNKKKEKKQQQNIRAAFALSRNGRP